MSAASGDGKRILVWGLASGVGSTLFLIVRDRTLSMGSAAAGNLDIFLLFGATLLAMVSARRSPPLSIFRALRIGSGVAVVSTALSRLYLFLQLRFVDDAWFDALRESARSQMLRQGLSEDRIQEFVDGFAPTALGYSAWNAGSTIVAGLAFSAILALFLRKSE